MDTPIRPGLRPRLRQDGRAATELTLLLVMLGFGLLAMGGLQLDALGKSEQGVFRKRAVEIARDQLALLGQRPDAEVEPRADFAPADWLSFPGREPGTLPVLVDPARRLQQVYTVSWRARPERAEAGAGDTGEAAAAPGLRLEVRVQWGGADGDPPHVYTASAGRPFRAPAAVPASASRPPAAPRRPDGAASRAGTRPSPAPPARSPR